MLPPGSVVEGHPKATGWMTRQNFLSFLEHFIKYTKPTKDSPVLLLLDNHKSHVSLDAIKFCRQDYVTMLSLPPHCSHELQPLDKTVYGPFKTFCNQASDRWCHDATNRGKPMTIHTLPSIVNYRFTHAFNQKNILSGFKSTGIYPSDRNIIPEDRFLPSYTTDRPMLGSEVTATGIPPGTPPTSSSSSGTSTPRTLGTPTATAHAPSTSTETTAAEISSKAPEETSAKTGTEATTSSSTTPTTSVPEASAVLQKTSKPIVSPFALRPFGKAAPRKQTKRKAMSSAIYTSSPMKNQLEEQMAKKNKKSKTQSC
ncbi:tigger transposable element-derived protein [Elysia marginata]|uniref:Tigger transposable element-derived protein n=1 Tax=Elysia marginata TaxID=1093978 RepID=A0AAV4JHK5_9GAST|nr:tigger transposable element-derived protein [Elysia marginata]